MSETKEILLTTFPEWEECEELCLQEKNNALHQFLYDNEPAGAKQEAEFRSQLADVILWAKNQLASQISENLLKIELALHASHNTVATDLISVEPSETSWRIDHSEELRLLEELKVKLQT